MSHWGDIHIRVVEEHIGIRSDWAYRDDEHLIIAHLDGPIRDIETHVDGVSVPAAPLGPGDVSLVPAGHRYNAQARGGLVRYAELRVAPRVLRDCIGDDDVARGGVRLVRRDAFLHRSVRRLAELTGRTDDVSRMAAHNVSHTVCLHLHEMYGAEDREASDDDDAPLLSARAEALRAYIREHLGELITLAALASLVGLSTHQLLIAFRERFGTTPAQYVIAERLRRVRWLLAHTAYDISTIAAATGFASHSHLTTTFQRRVGVTPRALRSWSTP